MSELPRQSYAEQAALLAIAGLEAIGDDLAPGDVGEYAAACVANARRLLELDAWQGDSVVRCFSCGQDRGVSFGACIANGWPSCCGNTMALIETPGEDVMRAAMAMHLDDRTSPLLFDQFAALARGLRVVRG
jgi:hypothetical protein